MQHLRPTPPFLASSGVLAQAVKVMTRCHSVFDAHSSSGFFYDRCVATERTVNFEPLLFRA